MKRTGHLFEQVLAWENLLRAAREAAKGKSRQPAVARYLFHLELELLLLEAQLREGSWRPGPYTRFRIVDPKPRQISAAPFSDRVVHHALMQVLDPYFDRVLVEHTYACRRGKGTHAAVRQAQRWARRYPFVLQMDIDRFFETAPHAVIRRQMRRLFKDRRLLAVLDRILAASPWETMESRGLPIGNLTSQYFANHLLGDMDHYVKQRLRAGAYLRYMDDSLLFGHNKGALHRHRIAIRDYLRDVLGLELKERAAKVAPVTEGISFLGFRIFPGTVRVDGRRWRRSLSKIRRREAAWRAGTLSTRRLQDSVQSCMAHWQHGCTLQLRRSLFTDS